MLGPIQTIFFLVLLGRSLDKKCLLHIDGHMSGPERGFITPTKRCWEEAALQKRCGSSRGLADASLRAAGDGRQVPAVRSRRRRSVGEPASSSQPDDFDR